MTLETFRQIEAKHGKAAARKAMAAEGFARAKAQGRPLDSYNGRWERARALQQQHARFREDLEANRARSIRVAREVLRAEGYGAIGRYARSTLSYHRVRAPRRSSATRRGPPQANGDSDSDGPPSVPSHTPQQTASILEVPVSTIQTGIDRGTIPAIRRGGPLRARRYVPAEHVQYLKAKKLLKALDRVDASIRRQEPVPGEWFNERRSLLLDRLEIERAVLLAQLKDVDPHLARREARK